MKKGILSLILLAVLACPAFAESSKVITLQDGSRINGNIIGMDNGSYIVETPSMGELKIADSNVASITSGDQPSASGMLPNITATPEFKSIQAQVMSNPDIINDIQQLMQDPEIMSLLSEPGFLTEVQSGNASTLQLDPRLKRLSENPKIQALIEKIKSGQ